VIPERLFNEVASKKALSSLSNEFLLLHSAIDLLLHSDQVPKVRFPNTGNSPLDFQTPDELFQQTNASVQQVAAMEYPVAHIYQKFAFFPHAFLFDIR
jgi:hypothetical protein